MLFKELLSKLTPPQKISQNQACFDIFRNEVCPNEYGYPVDWESFEVYSKGFGEWCCTDSWVGWVSYWYKDELIAVSYQSGRKWARELTWVSLEKAEMVKAHILDIIEKDEINIDIFKEEFLNKECGKGFVVSYPSQLLTKQVLHRETGEIVTVVEDFFKYAYKSDENIPKDMTTEKMFHGVIVEFSDGKRELAYLDKDLLVPWNIS